MHIITLRIFSFHIILDDLNIHGKINYLHYFYIFFFTLINGVIIVYLGSFYFNGSIKLEGMSEKLLSDFLSINLFIFLMLLIRFLIIKYVIEIFLSSKFKFIFFKNYIINIVIGLLLFFNFVIYNLNSFYTIDSLKHVFFILIGLHFIFQTKNYMSLIIKSEAKEFIYFILYLCAFKLAPWLWLYQDLYST
ncbi:MAG: DUF4271 domain-containing protein [Candidatus Marisimplicoccus sp.]